MGRSRGNILKYWTRNVIRLVNGRKRKEKKLYKYFNFSLSGLYRGSHIMEVLLILANIHLAAWLGLIADRVVVFYETTIHSDCSSCDCVLLVIRPLRLRQHDLLRDPAQLRRQLLAV